MSDQQEVSRNEEPRDETATTYEPPKVESVVTAEELAREIQYAGVSG